MKKMINVSSAEFAAYIAAYPRELERDVTGICEPPLVSYNDFTLAPKWPESIVACYLDGTSPDDETPSNHKILSEVQDKEPERRASGWDGTPGSEVWA